MVARLISQDDESHVILLDRPMIIVGRHPTCEARLDSPRISRRHCCVGYDHQDVVVRDLGSTNGIRINGQRVDSGKLRDGDEFTIAHLKFRFQVDSTSSPSSTDPPRGSTTKRTLPGDSRTVAAALAEEVLHGEKKARLLADNPVRERQEPPAPLVPEPPSVRGDHPEMARTSSIDLKDVLAGSDLPIDLKRHLMSGSVEFQERDLTPEAIKRLLKILIQHVLGDDVSRRIALSIEVAPPSGRIDRVEGGAPLAANSNGLADDAFTPLPSSSGLSGSGNAPRN